MKKVLVTGGCGFIGMNVVLDRLGRGESVRVLDNCARPGTELNRDRLDQTAKNSALEVVNGDIRDAELVTRMAHDVDVIFHMAAQVAVTTSVEDPRKDFEVNALGTINLLEAARASGRYPITIFASTNKVYGALESASVRRDEAGYAFGDLPFGVPEEMPLDFHSPYGCSKGSADQYFLDYARIYALPTVVLRQSCIYGMWQYGNEDQGWVAHFARRALAEEGVTIYGDGYQVRDVLFVSDLVDLYECVLARIDTARGKVYNIGGGSDHAISIRQCISELEGIVGHAVPTQYEDWRLGDQRVYVSDVRRAESELGWRPSTPFDKGLRWLIEWLEAELDVRSETTGR